MMLRVMLVLTLGLVGCVGVTPADDGCPGEVPALSECARGFMSADCGGPGEPVFACAEGNGECLWFASSCVATGYQRTACDAADPCCVPRHDGTWPYETFEPTGPYLGSFLENVAAYGSLPVGPDEVYPIAVTYDAARAYAEPGLVCEEGGTALVCSARVFQPPTFMQRGEDWVATFTGQLGTRAVTVMLVLRATEDAPATARAYYYIAADFSPPMGTCEDAGTPEGIVTGSVFLNQSPEAEGTRGEASLVLPDGTQVVFAF